MIQIYKYNTTTGLEISWEYDETIYAKGDSNFAKNNIYHMNLTAEKQFYYWFAPIFKIRR